MTTTDTKPTEAPAGDSPESRSSEVVPGWEAVTEGMRRVRRSLPTPGQCAFFGGLGALAALSVIEWPVAAAIAIGAVVAQRGERANGSQPESAGA